MDDDMPAAPVGPKCPLCLEDKPNLHTMSACEDQICSDCLTAYLKANLKNAQAYPIKCFSEKCRSVISYNDVTAHLDEDEVSTYDRFLIRSAFVLGDSRAFMCPLPNCKAVIVCDPTAPLLASTASERKRPESGETTSDTSASATAIASTSATSTSGSSSSSSSALPSTADAAGSSSPASPPSSSAGATTASFSSSSSSSSSTTTSTLKVTCDDCKGDFCWQCQAPWAKHEGRTCAQLEASLSDGRSSRSGQQSGSGVARANTNTTRLEQLAKTEHWVHCPACNALIERSSGCFHMSHFRSQGCRGGVGEDLEATHFCSLCMMVLFGPQHKTEADRQTLHFPWGLFKDCRIVAAQKAGVDAKKYFPGPDDPYPDDKLKRKTPSVVARAAPAMWRRIDLDRFWRNSLLCCCLPITFFGGEGCPSKEVCLTGLCCPCYLAAANVEQLEGDGRKVPCACYVFCCPIYAPLWRWRIRRMFGLRGCFPCDLLTAYLCFPCGVIQEHNELQSRSNQPHRDQPPIQEDMI